jgi:hypothetical protein
MLNLSQRLTEEEPSEEPTRIIYPRSRWHITDTVQEYWHTNILQPRLGELPLPEPER